MKNYKKYIESEILESIDVKKRLLNDEVIIKKIGQLSNILVNAYKTGNKAIFAGNGGSAADAQHLAAELVSRFYYDRPGLPSLALTTDTSIITAIGNDYGFEYLFRRQLEANAQKGDIFIAITTSGNSRNIIEALTYCREKGIFSVVLTGNNGGKIFKENLSDLVITVPSDSTPKIQECHIVIGHILCAIIEQEIFPCKQ